MKKYDILLMIVICVLCLSGCTGNVKEEHNGISVFVTQNPAGSNRVFYSDTDSFLREFGFDQSVPYFEYYDADGALQMTLYYDEQSKHGCGIRYYERDPSMFSTSGLYGFTFEDISQEIWNGPETDYHEIPPSPILQDNGDFLQNCRDNYVYDGKGRIIHIDSLGILTGVGDTEASTLLQIDFTYHENGNLKHRLYRHNTYIGGTYGASVDSYFDEQEHLLYEYRYVTHGCEEYYYIYKDHDTPVYSLMLDFNTGDWIPEFVVYQSSENY